MFYFLNITLDSSYTPLSLYALIISLFSPSRSGYLYSNSFLSSFEGNTLSRSKLFLSAFSLSSFIINSILFTASSSDAFITKFSPVSSTVTSNFGFVTAFISCSSVSVLLSISTTINVNVCCPFGISIVFSAC